MKGYYFTILMLSALGIASANAADYTVSQTTTTTGIPVEVPAPRKSEVPEYDVIDKSQLGNRRGFVAMNVGNELTADSAERYGRTFVENDAGLANNTSLQPTIPSGQNLAMNNNGVNGQVLQSIEPAAGGNVAMPTVTQPKTPNVVVMQDPSPQPEVITTYYVVGNTDTGVNMDEVQRLID